MGITYNKCPVCHCSNIEPYLECRDYLVSGESFTIYRCAGCRLEFTQNHPDEKESGRFYQSVNYIPHSDTVKSFTGKTYYTVRKFMLSRKKNLVLRNTGKSTGSLLDFGSGTGHFAAAMKKAGWDITGIELNKEAREYSAKNFGIKVIGPEEIKKLPSGSFDCITLWHVLEHLHNPYESLTEIKRLLKHDGVLLVALPNNMSFDSIHYRSHWAAYDVPRHLWHFNPVSLSCQAALAGFEIFSMKRLPFDVFYISILSEKYRGSRIPVLKGIIKGSVFFLLSLFDLARSSSIVYLLKHFQSAADNTDYK